MPAVEADSPGVIELQQVNDPSAELNVEKQRHPPLFTACADGNVRMVEQLLASGADPNVQDYRHRTPLHAAAAGGFSDCLRLLLQSGARVDVNDHKGLTPLGVARDAASSSVLLEADAALSAADLRLLLRERPAAVQQLLDGGVQPGDGGVLLVSYKPFRNIGGTERSLEAELVTELQRSGRWDLLGHPAVELLLELTPRRPLYMFRLFDFGWYILFLLMLVVTVFVKIFKPIFDVYLMPILLAMNIMQLLILVVLMAAIGSKNLSYSRYFFGVLKVVLTFVVVFLPITSNPDTRVVYGISVLIAFGEFIRFLDLYEKWMTKRICSTLIHVTLRITCYVLLYLPLLLATLVYIFIVMFDNGKCRLFERDPLAVAITMVAVMLGDVNVIAEMECTPHSLAGHIVSILIFAFFVVIAPIAMLNLLLALTISDTNEFLSRADDAYRERFANRIIRNQQAALMLHDRVHRLKRLMPKCLFPSKYLDKELMQLKRQNALLQPSREDGTTPHIIVEKLVREANAVKRLVKWGKRVHVFVAGRNFIVRGEFRRKLDAIVEARTPAGPVASLLTGLMERLSGIQDVLERQQATLERQRSAQDDMLERLMRVEDMLTNMPARQ